MALPPPEPSPAPHVVGVQSGQSPVTDTADASSAPVLMLAHCPACGVWTYPAHAWACRACGTPALSLDRLPPPQSPRLLEWVSLHANIVPGLAVPCVIGEVELAPGVVEEALIAATDPNGLSTGLRLRARAVSTTDSPTALEWVFHPDPAAP